MPFCLNALVSIEIFFLVTGALQYSLLTLSSSFSLKQFLHIIINPNRPHDYLMTRACNTGICKPNEGVKYLGTFLTFFGMSTLEHRLLKARGIFSTMNTVWKIPTYELGYSAATWTLGEGMRTDIRRAEYAWYYELVPSTSEYVMDCKFSDDNTRTHRALRAQDQIKSMTEVALLAKAKLAGKIAAMSPGSLPWRVLSWGPIAKLRGWALGHRLANVKATAPENPTHFVFPGGQVSRVLSTAAGRTAKHRLQLPWLNDVEAFLYEKMSFSPCTAPFKHNVPVLGAKMAKEAPAVYHKMTSDPY